MRGIEAAFRSSLMATLLLAGSPAQAQADGDEEPEFHAELVHADVPLYGHQDDLHPQNFSNGNEFGCMSRVATGDWTLKRSDEPGDDPQWLRLANYGVFHCAIVESEAYDRAELDKSGYRYSFFVQIGKASVSGRGVELWVLQSGTTPGSDYMLLARVPADGIIASFDVLQTRCPAKNRREGPQMDVWNTRYCAINSRAELIALAKAMVKLPPLGKLDYAGEAIPEEEKTATEAEAEPVTN